MATHQGHHVIPAQAVEAECRHLLVKTYSRPWWNWFRKTYTIRCWRCPIEIPGKEL